MGSTYLDQLPCVNSVSTVFSVLLFPPRYLQVASEGYHSAFHLVWLSLPLSCLTSSVKEGSRQRTPTESDCSGCWPLQQDRQLIFCFSSVVLYAVHLASSASQTARTTYHLRENRRRLCQWWLLGESFKGLIMLWCCELKHISTHCSIYLFNDTLLQNGVWD